MTDKLVELFEEKAAPARTPLLRIPRKAKVH
jgi:hypothetical protein